MQKTIVTSFVHGYNDLEINLPDKKRPALWVVGNKDKKIYSYPFPRNPKDFKVFENMIIGEMPYENAVNFKKLPRFGFTGLAQDNKFIYAGSWNSVYQINKQDYKLEGIISNHLMNDMHGIYADNNIIITILTCKDTVVISDHQGNILDHFTINKTLEVFKYNDIDETDWRFVSKQHRGSTGFWHFNYVQKFDNEIWLTSRNANCFVVIDINTKKAQLRLMNFNTPVLLHDGVKVGEKFYFTSIDGKILIAESGETTNMQQHNREDVGNMHLYNRDLVTVPIRLNETKLGKEPNWCRGIDVSNGIIYLTIDGRYDTNLSFGLLALKEENQEILYNYRLKWAEIGVEEDIRFVTGFDVLVQR